jgi:hypothetical protein
MELFYSQDVSEHLLTLSEEEARHCVKVLRHKVGDEIFVIDGQGQLLKCILTATGSSRAEAEIVERTPSFGGHPYHLTMAVCPTKNSVAITCSFSKRIKGLNKNHTYSTKNTHKRRTQDLKESDTNITRVRTNAPNSIMPPGKKQPAMLCDFPKFPGCVICATRSAFLSLLY